MEFPKLSAVAKRFFSTELKTLHKAGFLDGNNDLTDYGREHLEAIVVEKFMPELVVAAQEEKERRGIIWLIV